MKKNPVTLNPTNRPYNIRKYYEHLYMLSYLPTQTAQLFIAPLIYERSVPCLLMEKLQKC
jgi:hypothetical protein